MTADNLVVIADQNRIRPAEALDRSRDQLDLPFGMRAGISRVGPQFRGPAVGDCKIVHALAPRRVDPALRVLMASWTVAVNINPYLWINDHA